jgi:hypothetical protein
MTPAEFASMAEATNVDPSVELTAVLPTRLAVTPDPVTAELVLNDPRRIQLAKIAANWQSAGSNAAQYEASAIESTRDRVCPSFS